MAEKIEVGYKPIFGENSVVYHKYIIYTDKNGNRFYARGGPGDQRGISNEAGGSGGGTFPYGVIVTEHGEYRPGTIDWDGSGAHPREVIATGDNLSEAWRKIERRIEQIQ